jgi:DNA-binding GntR family transcriptional regulator
MAANKIARKKTPKKAVAPPIIVSDIVERIREGIRRGRYVPGQRLIEADIIRELSASRARVRDALKRLADEGLVTIEEFRGASVKHFTLAEIRQIYRTRMALEGLAAGEFAAADEPKLKKRLEHLQQELNKIEFSGDHERFAKLNDEWHRLIIQGSDNQYVALFVDRLRVPIYRLLFSTFYNARRIAKANAGHRVISAAILDGNVPEAEKLMREHIAEGLQALLGIGALID